MKKIVELVLIIGVIFSITSCSLHVEKRRYRKGYHIDVSYHKNNRVHPGINPVLFQEQTAIQSTTPQQNKNPELKDSLVEVATKPVATKHKVIASKKKQPVVRLNKKRGDHCDIITFTDGTQQEVIVEEISETEVKYKKCSFKDGPSYRTSKANIKKIDMHNGEVYIPQNTSKVSNGQVTGPTITSLVLGVIALVCVIIGAILAFSSGWIASAALAPAGILSLVGLIIGATQMRKGAHPLAFFAFFLNVFVQILAIIFTVLMFY